MSRKYKFYSKNGMYFVSFATVKWISVFIREKYFEAIIESLRYCQDNEMMELYGYCIMPNHIHLIFHAPGSNPMETLREFKRYTAGRIIRLIQTNMQESRREWLLAMMRNEAKQTRKHQFWQHHNKPIQLWSNKVITQKLDYIHMNPIEAGFVMEAHHWRYSSAANYAGEKGEIDITLLTTGWRVITIS